MEKAKTMAARLYEELVRIQAELDQRNNLAEVYARYANRLAVESDCGENQEEHEFLCEIVGLLKAKIVAGFMRENDWYIDENDDWHRWKKEV